MGDFFLPLLHFYPGKSGTGAGFNEEFQAPMATEHERVLMDTERLMDRICEKSNWNEAFKRVKSNKGSAGVDRKTIAETELYLRDPDHAQALKASLLTGAYQPHLNRGVQIPKKDGGVRQLGIPTVIDRTIQQALLQALTPIYEPQFSEGSYGFRPKRSAHDALKQASAYVESGRHWVVDLDLEKYFDTVNHDRLMYRLSRDIKDKRVLSLIGRYLRAGLLQDGVVLDRQSGTPQGGPLSPLLSNIVLDELDKELESRGHKFCRYADDCNIYVASQAAAERVKRSVTAFIEGKLKLKVNEKKSACAEVKDRQFLGYRISNDGTLRLSEKTQSRMRKRVIRTTKRNRGCSLAKVINELNVYLQGWMQYFRLANNRSLYTKLDSWIRRRLRSYRLKQRKRRYPIACWLMQLGVSARDAWKLAMSSKSWWRKSQNPVINQALPNAWFKEQGLISLLTEYDRLNVKLEPPYATNACTVV